MTTRRHKCSVEEEQAKAREIAEGVWEEFRVTFPAAESWVIFSAIAGVREAGIGNESERLKDLDRRFEAFLESPHILPSSTQDILVVTAAEDFVPRVSAFVMAQSWMTRPVCSDPSESEPLLDAKIAYEFYWTE